MRYSELMELTGVKKYKDMTATDLIAQLSSDATRFNLLGRGSNAIAVMINGEVYKFWMKDSAYDDFVAYCIKNQGNKFLPKFKSGVRKMPAFFLRHAEAPDYVNYVKIEFLDGETDQMDYKFELNSSPERADSVSLSTVCVVCAKMVDSEIPLEVRFTNKLTHLLNKKYSPSCLTPDLILFINTLDDIRKLGHELDLHGGNFMGRHGVPVILDPICNEDDLLLNVKLDNFDYKSRDIQHQIGKTANTSYKGIR